jgi:hypothetical protein
MALKALNDLIAHPAPGFACYASNDPAKSERLMAPVSHRLMPAASAADLKKIPNLPGSGAAKEFYQSHNGALLFTGGLDEGVEIFPLDQWDSATEYMLQLWKDGQYDDDRLSYGRNDFIAFAAVRGATTPIQLITHGRHAGAIYWWPSTMPPYANEPAIAPDFASFIDLICTQPVHFFTKLLSCYLRFSDGKTPKQWIPSRYLPDIRGHKLPS